MPSLLRNRVTERDIRDWLSSNGFEGGSATLDSVELFALKRPGWKQLFQFEGKVRPKSSEDGISEKVPVWGVALDDEREKPSSKLQVFLFDSEEGQRGQLLELSEDMIRAKSSDERAIGFWPIIAMVGFFATLILLIATIKSLL